MWNIFSRDPFPDYELLEEVDRALANRSLWCLRKARRRSNNEFVSAFIANAKNDMCHETFRRIKTLKHPNILSYIDGKETESNIYIITECVIPLERYLNECEDSESKKMQEVGYGLSCVARALKFLHEDAKLFHNNIQLGCIYVSKSRGNWLLGDLDFCSSKPVLTDKAAIFKLVPQNFSVNRNFQTDHWGLGCLIWEIFNNPSKPFTYKNTSKIPSSLVENYKKLMTSSASGSVLTEFLDCSFLNCDLSKILNFMNEIQLYSSAEKRKMLSFISKILFNLPERPVLHGLFPLLLSLHELDPSLDVQILTVLMSISSMMSPEDFTSRMLPVIVNMFSSNDRALRLQLLSNLDKFVKYFTPALVNDSLFVPISRGLLDTHPALREATLRTLLLLTPLLNHKNLNIELMRILARIQSRDTDDGIRTNTTVLLSHIAPRLDPSLRSQLLFAAFSRALHDPFPPARQAGVSGFYMTKSFFNLSDIANKILPCVCPSLIDVEESVRSETFKLVTELTAVLKKVSDDPTLAADMEKDVSKCDIKISNETTWTGWALSSIAQQIRIFQGKKNQASVNLKTSGDISVNQTRDQISTVKTQDDSLINEEWSDALSDASEPFNSANGASSPLQDILDFNRSNEIVAAEDSSPVDQRAVLNSSPVSVSDWNESWGIKETVSSSCNVDTDDFFNELLNVDKKKVLPAVKEPRSKAKPLKLGAKRLT